MPFSVGANQSGWDSGVASRNISEAELNSLDAIVPSSFSLEKRSMPHDETAEAAILSAMINSPDVLQECMIELKEDDFYSIPHRLIFAAMHEMFDKAKSVDLVSLADTLNTQGNLTKIGGRAFLIELGTNSLSLGSWEQYVQIIRRDTTLRLMITASAQIAALAFDAPEDTKSVVDGAEKLLFGVTDRDVRSNYVKIGDVASELYASLGEMKGKSEDYLASTTVETCFPTLDKHLLGFRPGQMIVVGARPGVGKTSFALTLAENAASKGASVAFFSLEMSAMEIAQRLVSSRSKVNLTDIRSGKIAGDKWGDILSAVDDLAEYDIMIDDTPGTTVTEIRAKARRMLRGKKKGLVIVDYLQLMSPPSGWRRADSRATEVSEMSRGIKIMAKDLGVPVLALSQLSRETTRRKGNRPQLSDLRESGAIEQDADVVLLLDRSMTEDEANEQDRPDLGVTQAIIAKNRSGPLGIVSLAFIATSTRFAEVDTNY